jgi:cell division protein FtsB
VENEELKKRNAELEKENKNLNKELGFRESNR